MHCQPGRIAQLRFQLERAEVWTEPSKARETRLLGISVSQPPQDIQDVAQEA